MKLQKLITQYVAFRKSMGEDFESAESLLNTFCRRMGVEIDLRNVRAKQVLAFLAGTGPITRYWRRKYDTLRGLYRYATSRGLVTDTPLPISVPKMPERFVPYIYTREELHRLLDSTAYFPKYPRKLQAHTLRAILLLLYGAGLRVSEALALTLEDVDLSDAVITIRDTKFNKTRLVPLGLELNQVMVQFQLVEQRFKYLREHAGVSRADGASYQPRLHDLRHPFSVHRLTSWYQQGADVQKLLPQLATYLGHVNIAATQVYLTMTPELLQAASLRFERYAFQEVCHE